MLGKATLLEDVAPGLVWLLFILLGTLSKVEFCLLFNGKDKALGVAGCMEEILFCSSALIPWGKTRAVSNNKGITELFNFLAGDSLIR